MGRFCFQVLVGATSRGLLRPVPSPYGTRGGKVRKHTRKHLDANRGLSCGCVKPTLVSLAWLGMCGPMFFPCPWTDASRTPSWPTRLLRGHAVPEPFDGHHSDTAPSRLTRPYERPVETLVTYVGPVLQKEKRPRHAPSPGRHLQCLGGPPRRQLDWMHRLYALCQVSVRGDTVQAVPRPSALHRDCPGWLPWGRSIRLRQLCCHSTSKAHRVSHALAFSQLNAQRRESTFADSYLRLLLGRRAMLCQLPDQNSSV